MAGGSRKRSRGGSGPAGSTIRVSGKDGPQLIDSRGHRWTDAAEARFLETLAATCNVTRSARAAGFSTVAIHRRRSLDATFADRWQAALAQGYVRLEMEMVRRANEALEGTAPDPDAALLPVSFKDALNLLQLHRGGLAGEGRRRGRAPRPRSLDEARGAIVARLEAIEVMRRPRENGG